MVFNYRNLRQQVCVFILNAYAVSRNAISLNKVFDTYEKILCLLLIEEEDEKAPVKIHETINISIQM